MIFMPHNSPPLSDCSCSCPQKHSVECMKVTLSADCHLHVTADLQHDPVPQSSMFNVAADRGGGLICVQEAIVVPRYRSFAAG